ncbi:uncharacterized protein [Drosophila virilis]|uniref:uncharacterized protein n=1 Tax=Drosophila virilis TaxID=7244 RepID=UPI0038B2F252
MFDEGASANGNDEATSASQVAVGTQAAVFKIKIKNLTDRLNRLSSELDPARLRDVDDYELQDYISMASDLQAKFEIVCDGLLEVDHASVDEDLQTSFESTIRQLRLSLQRERGNRSKVQQIPHCSTFNSAAADDSRSTFVVPNHSRLPQLKLPEFSGGYTEWADFSNLFTTVIDKDPYLTNIEKLQHLRSCLKGTALDTIRSLEISNANYAAALELLDKRFNNKRLIFQAHISEILGLRKVDKGATAQLREFSDKLNSHLRALKSMGSVEQIAGCVIVHTLLQKLDSVTQASWEDDAPLDVIPSCERFTTFIERRCQRLENADHATAMYTPSSQVGQNNSSRRTFVVTRNGTSACVFCEVAGHSIYKCLQFANLSPLLRLHEAKRLALCLNCLQRGHQLRVCGSSACRVCGSKHHSLLHLGNTSSHIAASSPNNAQDTETYSSSQNTLAALLSSPLTTAQHLKHDVVLLATAVINVKNRAGSLVPCRALLDSGSQLHIITSRLAHQLQLRKFKSTVIVSGIGDAAFASDGFSVNINVKSRVSEYSTCIPALIAPSITDNQPGFTLDPASWNIPSNIQLADPEFFKSQQIDMLIGASLFFDLLCVGQIKLAAGLPILQKTRLGWVATGGASHAGKSSFMAMRSMENPDLLVDSHLQPNTQIDELIRRFWELECCTDPESLPNKEERDCEAHFQANFKRLSTGDYSVRLPLRLGMYPLGDSYQQAVRRFLNLERKLDRNPLLKPQYAAFIKEYLDLGHMSLVTSAALGQCKYYLPHHCVLKEDSTTTKLRVVFDGSAVTTSGHSLNDALMAGPTIQPKLFSILMRFRTFAVALTGDICKMYRCVRVEPADSYFQCILWRESQHQKIQIYKLDTVTYGTKPASFLSVRAMHQLAMDEQKTFPIGSDIVKRDFYVDDLISGGSCVQEAIEILKQTSGLLAKGNFRLRKWCSSDTSVLQNIPEEDRETLLKFDDGSDITKTLGLVWDPASDCFLFSFSPLRLPSRLTKRSILSAIARFYDPLGLVGPVITKSKIFMQDLWRERLDWDESLPVHLSTAWVNFCADFEYTQQFQYPRRALSSDSTVEIHGFCDASLSAYGACVYTVSKCNGNTSVRLLCSKSRVAPVKTITVPKLELCGAALLAQLLSEICQMKVFDCRYYCWSDSAVTLAWIRNDASKFNVFVANRVAAIQELTTGMEWHHIPTELNPADIISRGALPSELFRSPLWAHGPSFLSKGKEEWPASCVPVESLPELRHKVLLGTAAQPDLSIGCKFINSFSKLQRVFAYVYKFVNRIRGAELTVDHLHHGTHWLLRSVQMATLSDDYKALKEGRHVKPSSSMASLAPFLDDFGLLRIGGRLKNSSLDFSARHPIILPRQHPVTRAIIVYFHKRNLHAGPRALLSSIRLQYWPIGGRKTVSSIVAKCIICFRAKPRLAEHIMADLPADRLNTSYPFMVTGVDYCGPFYYKNEVRNRPPVKCYISLFICFATKAVHLELVKDLSTTSFLNALKRFILTRSRPSRIWSDNATNFVGAKNELADLNRLFLRDEHVKAVNEFCLTESIEWLFIPPRSPHFGGLWEAAVKTAKHHFYRSVCSSILDFDSLQHPGDLDVLTPAHFLGTAPSSSYIEPDLRQLNFNRLNYFQRVTYLQQVFWARWREEYLTLLQQRSKWRTPQPGLSINDVVLVKDENLPPLKWPLARVQELISGSDGVSRVAVLQTATGVIRRAVRKLCLLPKQDDVESPCLPTGGECLVK